MRGIARLLLGTIGLGLLAPPAPAADGPAYFPPPEARGGWRSLVPPSGEPDAAAVAAIREAAGVDYDRLAAAWKFNAESPGATGLLVIRKGHVVGEWYRGGDRGTAFNIYSSSKAYTSTAFGLILPEFGNATPAGGKSLTLDSKVCSDEWLPESLPLPDPRKADITAGQLLQMASGLGEEGVPPRRPFEWSLGHVEGSPFARLKDDPGAKFHYSNAGVAHLVLLFRRAQGEDLAPFLKSRLFDKVGMAEPRWTQIGGDGALGPLSQGYSGIHTNPREHARFCYLALHKGSWDGVRVVPASYYDYAWGPSKANPGYGAQWWTASRFPGTPADFVATLGKDNNDGFVCPSKKLIAVRLGDGTKFPKDFDVDLAKLILAACVD